MAHGSHRRRELRRITRAFREAGALAPENAKSFAQIGLAESRIVRLLVERRVIREVRAGEYYLDEDAYREQQAAQLRWMLVPLAIALAMLAWGLSNALR